MQKLSLDALARELFSRATDSGASGAAGGSRAAHSAVLLTVVKQHSH